MYIKKYILLKNKIVIFKNKFLVFTFMNIKIFYFYYFVLKYILKYQFSVSLFFYLNFIIIYTTI